MKQKITLFLSLLAIAGVAFAQDGKTIVNKRSLLGISFNSMDVRNSESGSNKLRSFRNTDLGFSGTYWKLIKPKLDFSAKATIMFHDYANVDRNSYNSNNNLIGIELEPSVNAKLFNEENLYNAFLTGGLGFGYYSGKFGAYIPAGVGLQANFSGTSYVILQSQYRVSLASNVLKDNIFYSLGIAHIMGKEVEKPKEVIIPQVVDRDGDGVLDSLDKCPDVKGLASLAGCPDADADGVADADDKCPDVAGLPSLAGCPDADEDGIADADDKCPDQKGEPRYQGCPIPDTDGDGVNDEEDKCIDKAGPASNQGCPEIKKEVIQQVEKAGPMIQYELGSAKLKSTSFKSLDEIAKSMNQDNSLIIDIFGYCDNTGSEKRNLQLSQQRADAVKNYLVSKKVSVDRINTKGFGSSNPLEDNKSEASRAKNRRTEMVIRNH
jgi:outer membrane protein OmpA-like peptidoglycan-associated protein